MGMDFFRNVGLFGSPVSEQDDEPVADENTAASAGEIKQTLLDNLYENNLLDGEQVQAIRNAEQEDGTEEDFEEFYATVDQELKMNINRGGTGDSLDTPFSETFYEQAKNFIGQHEGSVPYLYDDSAPGRQPWDPQRSKGNPTIGIGFNIDRPDADELLKKVGSSKKEVMNNGVLDDGQQQELLRLAMAESMAWLRKEFKDVAMSRNQWMALASMAYNSRWNERGPTLIGPNLTRFIKDGDWQGAADEIRNRSNATKNRGLQIRREAEADMFLGTHPDLDPSELPTS